MYEIKIRIRYLFIIIGISILLCFGGFLWGRYKQGDETPTTGYNSTHENLENAERTNYELERRLEILSRFPIRLDGGNRVFEKRIRDLEGGSLRGSELIDRIQERINRLVEITGD